MINVISKKYERVGGSGNDCAYIRHMFNVITSSTPKKKEPLNENVCLSMSCTAKCICFITENHTNVGNQQVSLAKNVGDIRGKMCDHSYVFSTEIINEFQ